MNPIALVLIFFAASFTQSVSGFGFGLLSMGLLAGLLDLQTAAPTVALLSVAVQTGVLLRYRQSFDFKAVARLSVGALFGVPIGVWLLDRVEQSTVLHVLGVILVAYSIYALFDLSLPRIRRPAVAYPFGVVSGIFSGLYNIGGPPVIIYATCCDWSPNAFRSNLQGFFFASNFIVIGAHLIGRHFTDSVVHSTAIALPAVVVGLVAGFALDRHLLNPALFRKVVFVTLALIGLRLLF